METWYNWGVISHREAISYVLNLGILFLIIGMFGSKPTPFGILIFTVFNDYIFYKFSHKRFIDSDRKK